MIGIYKIQSKKFPDKFYIGKAKNIENRWSVHLSDLFQCKHHSNRLQQHYDEYGVDDLEIIILSCNHLSGNTHSEEYFINLLKPYFNSQGNSDYDSLTPKEKIVRNRTEIQRRMIVKYDRFSDLKKAGIEFNKIKMKKLQIKTDSSLILEYINL
jgi:group I intron endonuclease